MYIFTHKAAGSHRSLLIFFFGCQRFWQSSVYVHILMFLFVKDNRAEDE